MRIGYNFLKLRVIKTEKIRKPLMRKIVSIFKKMLPIVQEAFNNGNSTIF